MNASLLDASSSVVIMVDHQARLMPAIHDGRRVLADAACLAEAARLLGIPVIGTEQNPDKLGPIERAVRRHCDVVMAKMHFGACSDGLVNILRPHRADGRRQIVISGCEAHVCLLQTAMQLLGAEFNVSIVACASGSRRPRDYDLALQRIRAAGGEIANLEMVLFEWLRTCESPRFKAVLQLIKSRSDPGIQTE